MPVGGEENCASFFFSRQVRVLIDVGGDISF